MARLSLVVKNRFDGARLDCDWIDSHRQDHAAVRTEASDAFPNRPVGLLYRQRFELALRDELVALWTLPGHGPLPKIVEQ